MSSTALKAKLSFPLKGIFSRRKTWRCPSASLLKAKPKKLSPDLVLGLPQSQNAQMPAQYQKSSETFLINGTKISVHVLRPTRFPVSSRKFLDFLLLKETKNEVSRDI